MIFYDPLHTGFTDLDSCEALTHELAHRFDNLFIGSWNDSDFCNAIEQARAVLESEPQKFIRYSEQADTRGFVSDVFSAVCAGEYVFRAGHPKEYWKKDPKFRPLEIYANIFAMETLQEKRHLDFIEKVFPALMKTYRQIAINF